MFNYNGLTVLIGINKRHFSLLCSVIYIDIQIIINIYNFIRKYIKYTQHILSFVKKILKK